MAFRSAPGSALERTTFLFRNAIDGARTRYVPGLVLAELDYFLRDERPAMRIFMEDIARGAFTYAPPALDQLPRAMKIDGRSIPPIRTYRDMLNCVFRRDF